MSRGVKDLRELICVSRLTIRESDEEDVLISDEEGRISRFAYAAFDGYEAAVSAPTSRHSSAQSNKSRGHLTSPDSGMGTSNGVSPVNGGTPPKEQHQIQDNVAVGNAHLPRPPSTRKRQRKRKQKAGLKSLGNLPQSPTHELPKQKPLPPVRTDSASPVSITETESSEECAEISEPVTATRAGHSVGAVSSRPRPRHAAEVNFQMVNFDYMLIFLDAATVSEWLSNSNELVTDLTEWCHQGENFVQFAHFWLSEMPELQRQEILKLEYSILMDQFNLAFASGREVGQVKHKDTVHFAQAVFKEYPATLFSSKSSHTFLNYLDILTSERAGDYKKLLTDVRCSTKVKQHAQWTLACRAFCLVSVWSAVVRFFRTLQSDMSSSSFPQPALISSSEEGISYRRMFHAIRNEHLDVIHYLVTSGKVPRNGVDAHGRSLVFTAVVQNKVAVLDFLLKKIKCGADVVNRAADNGNTPLHAAGNVGDAKMVATLLNVDGIAIDAKNPQCENATPLHLAVMHGHEHVVEMLLVARADPTLPMGDLTPLTIARDFGHDSIAELIEGYNKERD